MTVRALAEVIAEVTRTVDFRRRVLLHFAGDAAVPGVFLLTIDAMLESDAPGADWAALADRLEHCGRGLAEAGRVLAGGRMLLLSDVLASEAQARR